MALIDLVKLNEEIDKMIAVQETEIAAMKTKIRESKENKYNKFLAEMEKYAEIAEKIAPKLSVFVGSYDTRYGDRQCYYVQFTKRRHLLEIYRISAVGDHMDSNRLTYTTSRETATMFGGSQVIDDIAEWYVHNPAEFEKRFESECIRFLKQKAEAANKNYNDTLSELKGAQT